jgi:transposase-like protein
MFSASEKYRIVQKIFQTSRTSRPRVSVRALCEVDGISVRSYYYWKSTIEAHREGGIDAIMSALTNKAPIASSRALCSKEQLRQRVITEAMSGSWSNPYQIYKELRRQGHSIGRQHVYDILSTSGLRYAPFNRR